MKTKSLPSCHSLILALGAQDGRRKCKQLQAPWTSLEGPALAATTGLLLPGREVAATTGLLLPCRSCSYHHRTRRSMFFPDPNVVCFPLAAWALSSLSFLLSTTSRPNLTFSENHNLRPNDGDDP